METKEKKEQELGPGGHRPSNTRAISLIALSSTLYVVASIVPIDAFIGGAGFITAGIVILPVIAGLLKPRDAVVAAVVASLGLLAFQLSFIPLFSFYGLLIPSTGIVLGSLAFHKSAVIPSIYVALGAFWYVAYGGGTLVWLIPYALALVLGAAKTMRVVRFPKQVDIAIMCLLATMCELVTMNIGSISVIHLPGSLWIGIFPFMLLERTVAVIGSSAILLALVRVKGPLRLELSWNV